jgi:transcriptional regulator with XRE-family HTH domain
MIFVEQIRAARALLNWSQNELASAADVGIATIQRIEGGHGPVRANTSTVMKLEKAFEQAGVRFLNADDLEGGVGVRLLPLKRGRKS